MRTKKKSAKATPSGTPRKTGEVLNATSEFSKGNIAAYTEAASAAGDGLKTISNEIALYFKRSVEESLSAIKGIMASKSIPEAMERQSSFAKMALGAYMGQLKLLNEMYAASLKDTLAPVQARIEEITNKASRTTE